MRCPYEQHLGPIQGIPSRNLMEVKTAHQLACRTIIRVELKRSLVVLPPLVRITPIDHNLSQRRVVLRAGLLAGYRLAQRFDGLVVSMELLIADAETKPGRVA